MRGYATLATVEGRDCEAHELEELFAQDRVHHNVHSETCGLFFIIFYASHVVPEAIEDIVDIHDSSAGMSL